MRKFILHNYINEFTNKINGYFLLYFSINIYTFIDKLIAFDIYKENPKSLYMKYPF